MWSKKINGDFKLKVLILHFFEDYFTFDNKILKSLKVLIFQPAYLTKAFFEGKRSRYVLPLRLYLFIAFISIFCISLMPESQQGKSFASIEVEKSDEDLVTSENSTLEAKELNNDIQKKIEELISEKSSIFILIELPIFAFLIFLFFYNKKYYYTKSFVKALHLQSFFFIALLFGNLLEVFISNGIGVFIGFLIYLVYSIIAIKRFYNANYFVTIIKYIIIQILQHTVLIGLIILYAITIAYFE